MDQLASLLTIFMKSDVGNLLKYFFLSPDRWVVLTDIASSLSPTFDYWLIHKRTWFLTDKISSLLKYEGKSLNNRNFIITFLQEYLQKLFVSPCFATHSVHLSTSLRMPSRKKLFGVAFNQLCTDSITSSSFANLWPRKCSFIGPNKWKSKNCLHTEPSFFCRFQVSHPLTTRNE